MSGKSTAPQVFFLESCGSTMDVAKNFAQKPNLQQSSFFVVTRLQTQGRGRLGRVWTQPLYPLDVDHTPSSLQVPTQAVRLSDAKPMRSLADVYRQHNEPDFLPFTLALSTQQLKIPLHWVSLLVGVAIYDAFIMTYDFLVEHFPNVECIPKSELELYLKWPNDLVWNNQGHFEKLAGILCEAQMQTNSRDISHIYIGIGINFFSCPPSENIAAFFQKILKNSAAIVRRSILNRSVLTKMACHVENALRKYLCRAHTLTQITQFVLKRSLPIGTILSVNHKTKTGQFCGLNEQGALLLMPISSNDSVQPSAQIETIYSAENIDIMNSSKNILCIDFGNTRIHIRGKNFKSDVRYSDLLYQDLESKKMNKSLLDLIKLFDLNFVQNITVFYVSVNSKNMTRLAWKNIKNILSTHLPKKKLQIKEITEKDIFRRFVIPKTFDHKTLGADRALKCVFAYQLSQQRKKNILIFSFGTATTCEGFSKDGAMIENFVFPGMQMSLNALHHFTALLPKINALKTKFVQNPKYWTQKTYLQRGVFLSIVSSVFTAIKLHSPCDIILTGGNAQEIKNTLLSIADEDMIASSTIDIIPNIETTVLAEWAQN